MKKISICMMTCGELTEQDCLKAIKPFIKKVEFYEVRNVFPQAKALNEMISKCNTKYLIPVDADIVLNKNAWDRIERAIGINEFVSNWHSILFPLWDTLTDRKILALKILNHEIIKNNLFKDYPTPDVEHYSRLTSQGFSCIQDYLDEEPIGKHIVKGKQFCYFKYKDVYQTYRSNMFEWDNGVFMGGNTLEEKANHHFEFFIKQWLKTQNDDYLHCIAGMVDGLTSNVENKSKTLEHKNYRIKSNEAIRMFMNWYNSAKRIKEQISLII